MFTQDLKVVITGLQLYPAKPNATSKVADVILRCRGTKSGGQIMSSGFYEGNRWIPCETFRSDTTESGSPMWKHKLTANQYVKIPATIWCSQNGNLFAKLDQTINRTDYKTYYKYRHILYDRNGSMENIALENMLVAAYQVLHGTFEAYNPSEYKGAISCMNCKSHVYVSSREEDENGAPLRRSKSVQELREEGPAIALHYCLIKQEWIDEDTANRFNTQYMHCPGTYFNEYNRLNSLGTGKILIHRPGVLKYKVTTREIVEVPEIIDETEAATDEFDDQVTYDVHDEEYGGRKKKNRRNPKDEVDGNYVIDDENSDKKYQVRDEDLLREIEEAKYLDDNKEAKTLWCSKKGLRSMFDQPGLTNEVQEVTARTYAVDYNQYSLCDLYQCASSCPHYASSYKKGKEWVNILHPSRAAIMRGSQELNKQEIASLKEAGSFKVLLSKTELIMVR